MVSLLEKPCSKCKIVKPITSFAKASTRPLGFKSACKDCLNAGNSEYYQKNKNRIMARIYGISPEQQEAMLLEQDNKCAICFIEDASRNVLQLDHDHQTGLARAWLCGGCNSLIAF